MGGCGLSRRKSLTKKLRFEIFKRDGFKCQYCGNTINESVLEVDHIVPVAEGGSNDEENLITSCFDCNRGKGARDLGVAPISVAEKAEKLKEKESQLKEFKRIQKSIKRRLAREAESIEETFNDFFPDCSFSDHFRQSVKSFLEKLVFCEVESAMELACTRMGTAEAATKYFCGICWRKVRGDEY